MQNTCGSRTMARPIATRWRWPPDRLAGLRSRYSVSPSSSAASATRLARSALADAPHLQREAHVLARPSCSGRARSSGTPWRCPGPWTARPTCPRRRSRIAARVDRLEPGQHPQRGGLARSPTGRPGPRTRRRRSSRSSLSTAGCRARRVDAGRGLVGDLAMVSCSIGSTARAASLDRPERQARTSLFWAIQPARTTGSAAIVAAAESRAQYRPSEVMKPTRNTGTVPALAAVRFTAKKNSFQAKMTQISAVAAMPGETIGRITSTHRAPQARAVDLGRLQQFARHLEEERPHHPHRDRQVHRGVEDDQRPDVVQQCRGRGRHVDRDDRRHDRQHLGADEEEQHVAGLAHRAAATARTRRAWPSSSTRIVDDDGREHRIRQRTARCPGRTPPGYWARVGAKNSCRRVGVRVALGLERREHHPQHREEEPDPDDPARRTPQG